MKVSCHHHYHHHDHHHHHHHHHLETGFLCVALASLETHYVDQAGLELKEIQLPLLPKCWY